MCNQDCTEEGTTNTHTLNILYIPEYTGVWTGFMQNVPSIDAFLSFLFNKEAFCQLEIKTKHRNCQCAHETDDLLLIIFEYNLYLRVSVSCREFSIMVDKRDSILFYSIPQNITGCNFHLYGCVRHPKCIHLLTECNG